MKKKLTALLAVMTLALALAGCGSRPAATTGFDKTQAIGVMTREEGSGTRGAFIELFGIQSKDAAGKKVDNTIASAAVTNSTAVMLTTVAGSEYAVGYISLGSLNDTVRALAIDGAQASVANVKAGTYKIVRPFNVAYKGTLSAAAQDFLDYIMSADGQAVITASGYIAVADSASAYSGKMGTGKVVVAGSSSVTPVMEKLAEAYKKLNSGVTIEVEQSDSTTGMTSAIDGSCDIGMASRELSDKEKAALTPVVIAQDGIAIIVNKDNPCTGLTAAQVKDIYTGSVTTWDKLG